MIRSRGHVEAGIREEGDPEASDFIRSNYFDLGMILDYWGPRRLNHHTEATSMLYAARECARVLLLEEGGMPSSSATGVRAPRCSPAWRAWGSRSSATSRTR